MEYPWTVVSLSASASVPALVAMLWLLTWVRRDDKKPPQAWLAVYCGIATLNLSCRILQEIGWSAQAPLFVSDAYVVTIVLQVWSLCEFVRDYVGRQRGRLEAFAFHGFIATIVVAVLGTQLILLDVPAVHPRQGGGNFMGVGYGPLLLPLHLTLVCTVVVSIGRGLASELRTIQGGAGLLVAIIIGVAAWVTDVVSQLGGLGWIRLSDYISLPVSLVYIYSNAQRYIELFTDMESLVARKTERLRQANEQLRREHAEREALQRRLSTKQRLEAVGRLASGIAHDFNNLLVVVFSGTELVRDERDEVTLHETLDEIELAAHNAQHMVSELLAFAKDQPSEPRTVAAGAHLERSRGLLKRVAGSQVEFEIRGVDTPAVVRIDPSHLDQVVLNLVTNARDAMDGSGQIRVELQTVAANDESVPDALVHSGAGAMCIVVSDDGSGMAPEVVERIFEPFYSTKGDDGTGLGLATVYSLISRAGGEVEVVSAVGSGTTFRVWLPLVEQ